LNLTQAQVLLLLDEELDGTSSDEDELLLEVQSQTKAKN
jgi:hypothetical protein